MNTLRRQARPLAAIHALLATLLALALTAAPASADSIAITGDLNATWTALGTGSTTGTTTLAYKTVGQVTTVGATKRAVTVRLLEALPPGVSATVTFTPDTGNGTSMGTITLTTTAQVLVDLILADIEQLAKGVNYTFSTSSGFTSISVKVEYALIDH